MNRAANMPIHYQEQLLDALMHHLPMETRHTVMREVPLAYNAYVGRTVMLVTPAASRPGSETDTEGQ